jgi:hypothetical protein
MLVAVPTTLLLNVGVWRQKSANRLANATDLEDALKVQRNQLSKTLPTQN